VVNVNWIDAVSFCDWLTKKERAEGTLGQTQRYRLLTDAEWSAAVGLQGEEGSTPQEKDRKNKLVYPWGSESIPPSGTENLAGQGETVLTDKELFGYTDGYSHTAGVGRFQPNPAGIYDLGGNVSEWVEDWFDARHTERTTRGAAFIYIANFDRCSSFRWHRAPEEFADYIGFRVALDVGSSMPR
jgi:formylglycine-generating enzyme required for sulfatase activity